MWQPCIHHEDIRKFSGNFHKILNLVSLLSVTVVGLYSGLTCGPTGDARVSLKFLLEKKIERNQDLHLNLVLILNPIIKSVCVVILTQRLGTRLARSMCRGENICKCWRHAMAWACTRQSVLSCIYSTGQQTQAPHCTHTHTLTCTQQRTPHAYEHIVFSYVLVKSRVSRLRYALANGWVLVTSILRVSMCTTQSECLLKCCFFQN